VLGGREWRGLEQAAILLTHLDHKPAAGRLLELLRFPRGEVSVTAAWGLRRLAVPETLPRVLSHVEAELAVIFEGGEAAEETGPIPDARDHRLSQLVQFLGRAKYAPAEPALRRLVPRPPTAPPGPEARAAGVWALGMVLEGKTAPDLAAALVQLLNDIRTTPPEFQQVRMMSALTLGRLKAKEALPDLRRFCPEPGPTFDPVRNACGWAIGQITGEPVPAPQPVRRVLRDWFLGPDR
jgi:hypothetical protein